MRVKARPGRAFFLRAQRLVAALMIPRLRWRIGAADSYAAQPIGTRGCRFVRGAADWYAGLPTRARRCRLVRGAADSYAALPIGTRRCRLVRGAADRRLGCRS